MPGGSGHPVLTPPWTWYDHGNDTDEPVPWMDGLDVPFVRDMDAGFFEPFGGEQQSWTKPVDNSERRYGIGGNFLVIPPWAWHERVNDTREEAILFSVQDTPIL
jgi:gentisate 1,2-dioxygenase